MSKNLDTKQLTERGKALFGLLQKYSGFVFILAILLAYTFLVFRISVLSQTEPTEEAVLEQSQIAKRLKVDQSSIDKIEELEDQNIGIQTLFETARQNPFQD